TAAATWVVPAVDQGLWQVVAPPRRAPEPGALLVGDLRPPGRSNGWLRVRRWGLRVRGRSGPASRRALPACAPPTGRCGHEQTARSSSSIQVSERGRPPPSATARR